MTGTVCAETPKVEQPSEFVVNLSCILDLIINANQKFNFKSKLEFAVGNYRLFVGCLILRSFMTTTIVNDLKEGMLKIKFNDLAYN